MRILVAAAVVVLTMMWAINVAHTESASGPSPKSVHLNFQVTIPSIVQLQIGDPGGSIQEVAFVVDDFPDVDATYPGSLSPVAKVRTILKTTQGWALTANSSVKMTAPGSSTDMPFTTISYAGAGGFAAATGSFDGTPSQSILTGTGRVDLTGSFSFTYHNSTDYDPGIYTGQVTYTLSAP